MKKILLTATLLATAFCQLNAQTRNNNQQTQTVQRVAGTNQTVEAAKDSLQNILRLAKEGDPRMQCIVGNWYYTGTHVPQSYSNAFDYYKRSAEKNNVALGNLGLCYQYGHGVEADSILAVQYYLTSIKKGNKALLQQIEKRADAGEPLAGVVAGKAAISDKRVKDAAKYLKNAADKGSVDAIRELGVFLLNQNNGKEAFQWFQKGADAGDANCIYYCGRMLREGGMGVPANPAQGINYLLRAADLQFPAAYYQLGQAYAKGLGVKKDDNQARNYFRKAAQYGNEHGTYELARLLIKPGTNDYIQATELMQTVMPNFGSTFKQLFEPSDTTLNGTPYHIFLRGMSAYEQKDFKTAEQLFKKVQKSKIPAAKTMLAMILLNKDNPKKNIKKGVKLLQEALKEGDARAASILAGLYREGFGVTKDEKKALEYYLQAAELGDAAALSALGDIYYEGALSQSRDMNKATDFYLKAGSLRSQKGAQRLAEAFRNGEAGLKKDRQLAERIVKSSAKRSMNLLTPYLPAL